MSGINKVIIIGNVGKEPSLKQTETGKNILILSVATSENWVDKNTNEKKKNTEWHNIVIFGKLADIVSKYVKKGSKVYIEGKLQTRKWQDAQGNDRYTTEIIISDFKGTLQILDKRNDTNEQPIPQNTAPATVGNTFTP